MHIISSWILSRNDQCILGTEGEGGGGEGAREKPRDGELLETGECRDDTCVFCREGFRAEVWPDSAAEKGCVMLRGDLLVAVVAINI